jgi:hypothetical protein
LCNSFSEDAQQKLLRSDCNRDRQAADR